MNPWPQRCERSALPAELHPQKGRRFRQRGDIYRGSGKVSSKIGRRGCFWEMRLFFSELESLELQGNETMPEIYQTLPSFLPGRPLPGPQRRRNSPFPVRPAGTALPNVRSRTFQTGRRALFRGGKRPPRSPVFSGDSSLAGFRDRPLFLYPQAPVAFHDTRGEDG